MSNPHTARAAEHARQKRMRPQVEKVIDQYNRGLLAVSDLWLMVWQIDEETT